MQIIHVGDSLDAALTQAGDVLAHGGVVAFPTETFYGLAVRADDASAVAWLVGIKGRQANKPIALIAASAATVAARFILQGEAERLARVFWPGPLTLTIAPRSPLPAPLVGPEHLVGVRVAGLALARQLAERAGGLITATSANLAGGAPAASVAELEPALVERIELGLDAGPTPGGLPSSVVTCDAAGRMRILRAGAISQAQLAAALHEVCNG